MHKIRPIPSLALSSDDVAHPGGPAQPRIALYSHDTQGLGHIRRNLLIARALSQQEANPVILLLSGVQEAAAFSMPSGVDCVTLPGLGKSDDGVYYPRSLGVSMEDLIQIRSQTLAAALCSFRPHLLIVDKVPLGVFDELDQSLKRLRLAGETRLVLGLREVLDHPNVVRQEWLRGDYEGSIREYYDRIWVYGDPKVYDPVKEYAFADDIAQRVRYTGYLNPLDVEHNQSIDQNTDADERIDVGLDCDRLALCVVGGGRDGVPLAEAFMRAELPPAMGGLLVTGPLMDAESRTMLKRLASTRSDRRVLEFVTNPLPFIRRADCVIAMGGYNTICEAVCLDKPTLIVPRIRPRTEQLIRAERFRSCGLVDIVHPDDLAPQVLSAWLRYFQDRAAVTCQRPDFDGVSRLPSLAQEALACRRASDEVDYAVG